MRKIPNPEMDCGGGLCESNIREPLPDARLMIPRELKKKHPGRHSAGALSCMLLFKCLCDPDIRERLSNVRLMAPQTFTKTPWSGEQAPPMPQRTWSRAGQCSPHLPRWGGWSWSGEDAGNLFLLLCSPQGPGRVEQRATTPLGSPWPGKGVGRNGERAVAGWIDFTRNFHC